MKLRTNSPFAQATNGACAQEDGLTPATAPRPACGITPRASAAPPATRRGLVKRPRRAVLPRRPRSNDTRAYFRALHAAEMAAWENALAPARPDPALEGTESQASAQPPHSTPSALRSWWHRLCTILGLVVALGILGAWPQLSSQILIVLKRITQTLV